MLITHDCLGRTILNPVLATIVLSIWMWISIRFYYRFCVTEFWKILPLWELQLR